MKKSNEERLTDIESGITRLTKMQDCVFNMLLVLDKMSKLISRAERSVYYLNESTEFTSQVVSSAFAYMFGAVTTMGISISLFALYFATKDLLFRALGIGSIALTLLLLFFVVRSNRHAGSQLKTTKSKLRQTMEQIQSAEEEVSELDDTLTQIVAEWKKLVPDDLVSKPKSEE